MNAVHRARRIAWGLVYLYTAWVVSYYAIHFGGPNYYYRASLDSMVEAVSYRPQSGVEPPWKPYVGRALMPAVIRGLDEVTPQAGKDALAAVFTSRDFLPDFHDPSRYTFHLGVFFVLCTLCYWGVALGGRAAFKAVYGIGGNRANFVGLLFLLMVPLWFRYLAYIYDPVTVLMATWLLYAAARSRIVLFCVLFVLACINKETAPLTLPLLVYGTWKRYPRYITYAVTAGLAIVAALIHVLRQGYFDAFPGTWTEHHWDDHQMIVLQVFTMSLIYAVVVMGGSLWLAGIHQKQKPTILKIGFLFTFVPLFLASLPFGFIDETRALFDAYPFVILLAMPTILALLGVPILKVDGGDYERSELPPAAT